LWSGPTTWPYTLSVTSWRVQGLVADIGQAIAIGDRGADVHGLRNLDVARVETGIDRIDTGEYGRGWALSRRSLKLMRATLAQALNLGVARAPSHAAR
jgi:hypothetical protein